MKLLSSFQSATLSADYSIAMMQAWISRIYIAMTWIRLMVKSRPNMKKW